MCMYIYIYAYIPTCVYIYIYIYTYVVLIALHRLGPAAHDRDRAAGDGGAADEVGGARGVP